MSLLIYPILIFATCFISSRSQQILISEFQDSLNKRYLQSINIPKSIQLEIGERNRNKLSVDYYKVFEEPMNHQKWRAQIFKGIQILDNPVGSNCEKILVFGENAAAMLTGSAPTDVVMSVAQLGKGRIVFFSHSTFLNNFKTGTNSDNNIKRLHQNLKKWVTKNTYTSNTQIINAQQFVKFNAKSNYLILYSTQFAFKATQNQKAKILQFVKNGGGLVVGLSISSQYIRQQAFIQINQTITYKTILQSGMLLLEQSVSEVQDFDPFNNKTHLSHLGIQLDIAIAPQFLNVNYSLTRQIAQFSRQLRDQDKDKFLKKIEVTFLKPLTGRNLTLHKNGDVRLYDYDGQSLWNITINGILQENFTLVIQKDGNLALKNQLQIMLWQSGKIYEETSFDISQCINLTTYKQRKRVEKSISSSKNINYAKNLLQTKNIPKTVCTILKSGQSMYESDVLSSGTGFNAVFQTDGNLVIYYGQDFIPKNQIWRTPLQTTYGSLIYPYSLQFLQNGTLMIKNALNQSIWSSYSNVRSTAPYILIMQRDGNLVVYDSTGTAVFGTSTDKITQEVTYYDKIQKDCISLIDYKKNVNIKQQNSVLQNNQSKSQIKNINDQCVYLAVGQSLQEGDYLSSGNGYYARLQYDANFVIYIDKSWRVQYAKWSSLTKTGFKTATRLTPDQNNLIISDYQKSIFDFYRYLMIQRQIPHKVAPGNYPGEIDTTKDNYILIDTSELTFQGKGNNQYYFTGYYAVAGQIVEIQVISQLQPYPRMWQVTIGHHFYSSYYYEGNDNSVWVRWPQIYKLRNINDNVIKIVSQFGGLIGFNGPYNFQTTLKVRLRNVVEAPYFNTKNKQSIKNWATRKNSIGVWGSVQGQYVGFILQQDSLKTVQNPQKVLNVYDKIYKQLHYLRGTNPNDTGVLYISQDIQYKKSNISIAQSEIILLGFRQYGQRGVYTWSGSQFFLFNFEYLMQSGHWQIFGKIGQFMQQYWWSFSQKAWFSPRIIYVLKAYEVIWNKSPKHVIQRYLNDSRFRSFEYDDDVQSSLRIYGQIIQDFGFDLFRKVFSYYYGKYPYFPTYQDKVDYFWGRISIQSGYSFSNFMIKWDILYTQNYTYTIGDLPQYIQRVNILS